MSKLHLLMALALLSLTVPAGVASADSVDPPRGTNGKLVFRSVKVGAGNTPDIWAVNANGRTEPRQVTCGFPPPPRGPGYNFVDMFGPAWSPDGQTIIFYRQEQSSAPPSDPRQYLYVIDTNDDCGPGTLLTEGRFADWSPVMNRIVFDRGSLGVRDIWVRERDGTETNLTNDPGGRNTRASWSPDGSKIAFASARGCIGNGELDLDIWVINDDGSNLTRLTFDCADQVGHGNNGPHWSPDGQKIVFQSSRDSGDLEIYVMNADGSEPARLTNHKGTDANPKWAPDGRQIVFHRDVNDGTAPVRLQLFIINADGSDLSQLTGGQTINSFAAWGAGHDVP